MTRIHADNYGRGELAHLRVSASSAVKSMLVSAASWAGSFAFFVVLDIWFSAQADRRGWDLVARLALSRGSGAAILLACTTPNFLPNG